jgi:hypothetical protein
MTGPQKLLALALGILAACSGPQRTLHAGNQKELVTLDQEAGENGLCHVHYQNVGRTAPCTDIATLMRSELRVPTRGTLVLRPSKGVRSEDIARLIKSLLESGYQIDKVGYITTR